MMFEEMHQPAERQWLAVQQADRDLMVIAEAEAQHGRAIAGVLRAVCGRNLAAQRVRRGWTQAQLADTAGVARSFISDIERGRTRVALQDWVPLLQALDVGIAAILAGDEPDVARARRVLLGG